MDINQENQEPLLLKTTHEGVLELGEKSINCAILEDGTRVLLQTAVFKAFDRPARGNARLIDVPVFIDAKNLQPFIDESLKEMISPIEFLNKKGKKTKGFNAKMLPLLCKIYLDAREAGVLTTNQLPLARNSEILLLGLANVGIVALVDEATGYQYERDENALQSILKLYIRSEFLKWTSRFPMDFYKELFRLRGWEFDEDSTKRPILVGKLTNALIYEQLPEGVLEELRKKNPKNGNGRRRFKHHQFLTEDVGNPHLEKQLVAVTTLMRISSNWRKFKSNFNRAFPTKAGDQQILFDDIDDDED